MRDNYKNRQNTVENEVASIIEENVVETFEKNDPDVPESVDSDVLGANKVSAVVSNCTRLNVREKPDKSASIVDTIKVGDEVIVDLIRSTDTFYKVCDVAGIEGFCMKQYISIHP